MKRLTRRDFLKALGAAAAGSLAVVRVPASILLPARPFEVLVVGDSLIWGQGLHEKDKMYTLTADWLRTDVFNGDRPVGLTVEAHSGSTLKFHEDEAEKYKAAGCDETFYHEPEVNVGFPSTYKQIEVAAGKYRSDASAGADLILLSGGITDITTSRVFDPRGSDDELRREIEQYCLNDMTDILEHAARLHPNALIAVIGYFPVITPASANSKLLNTWLESMGKSAFEKFIINNPIVRPLFFSKLKKRAIARSRLWLEGSDNALATAVDRLNSSHGRTRAIFVRSPLTEDEGAEAPGTKLFRMGDNGMVTDPLAEDRTRACNEALPELKRTTGIDYPVRLCEIAAIGHPNPEGEREYARAIIEALTPHLAPAAN